LVQSDTDEPTENIVEGKRMVGMTKSDRIRIDPIALMRVASGVDIFDTAYVQTAIGQFLFR